MYRVQNVCTTHTPPLYRILPQKSIFLRRVGRFFTESSPQVSVQFISAISDSPGNSLRRDKHTYFLYRRSLTRQTTPRRRCGTLPLRDGRFRTESSPQVFLSFFAAPGVTTVRVCSTFFHTGEVCASERFRDVGAARCRKKRWTLGKKECIIGLEYRCFEAQGEKQELYFRKAVNL